MQCTYQVPLQSAITATDFLINSPALFSTPPQKFAPKLMPKSNPTSSPIFRIPIAVHCLLNLVQLGLYSFTNEKFFISWIGVHKTSIAYISKLNKGARGYSRHFMEQR